MHPRRLGGACASQWNKQATAIRSAPPSRGFPVESLERCDRSSLYYGYSNRTAYLLSVHDPWDRSLLGLNAAYNHPPWTANEAPVHRVRIVLVFRAERIIEPPHDTEPLSYAKQSIRLKIETFPDACAPQSEFRIPRYIAQWFEIPETWQKHEKLKLVNWIYFVIN